MKAFINIIIIGLIGLCSSTYLFNLSPIDYKGTIEIETPVAESTLRLQLKEDKIVNPESVTINHISSKEEVIRVVTENIFSVDIYKNNKLIKGNIKNLELMSPSVDAMISVSGENPISTSLNISQKNLSLEDGVYKFVFNSNLIVDKNNSISTLVTYDTAGNYYPSVDTALPGTKGLTLYFTSENSDVLIPVTRFVVEDKSITRMAIEQLQNGPINGGLKSIIKNVTNTTYNNGNVVIDIPSSYELYNDKDIGLTAFNSFIKTIFAVERYWPIHSVSFTVDRNKVDTYFNGIDSVSSIPNTKNYYLLFMAYKAEERYYLFDYQLQPEKLGILENDSIDIKAKKIFDYYFNPDISYGISPVPKTVTLNDASLNGSTLILNFNKNLLNAYKDRNDLRHMMIESLVYTYTTMPGVNSIKIIVEGEELNNFVKGIDTTKVLYPPEFINPEIVE